MSSTHYAYIAHNIIIIIIMHPWRNLHFNNNSFKYKIETFKLQLWHVAMTSDELNSLVTTHISLLW